MRIKNQAISKYTQGTITRTPTVLFALPLHMSDGRAIGLRTHLEVGRSFSHAVLCAGQKRRRRLRAEPLWQLIRAIPYARGQKRRAVFARLWQQNGFSRDSLKRQVWRQSTGYQQIRRRKAEKERQCAAHHKSRHRRIVCEIMTIGHFCVWEDAEACLRAAQVRIRQWAKERQVLPQSSGLPRAGVRRSKSLRESPPAFPFRQGRLEVWTNHTEPPWFEHGELSNDWYDF